MLVIENIKLALSGVKSNLLRAVLTMLIIAIGILALVGILTTIDGIKTVMRENFAVLGANSFKIMREGFKIHIGGSRRARFRKKQEKNNPRITYDESVEFKNYYEYPSATVSLEAYGSFIAEVKYKTRKTNPNIGIIGTDEGFLVTQGYKIQEGRNFSANELENGEAVAIIGNEVATNLFPNENPMDKNIFFGGKRYLVIGTLAEKGSAFGFGGDRVCMIPVTSLDKNFPQGNRDYTINVNVANEQNMTPAIEEAVARFRIIRKQKPVDEDNFDISKTDAIAAVLIENMKFITLAATIIGMITLFGAAVGLMNIMLVSVTERTREIGIRKSLGATRKNIRRQFLTEAILICQFGGALGIALGIAVGNLITMLIGGRFIVPWFWILGGITLCFIVGLVSGIYPAWQASRLDPVESLRYE